MEENKKKSADNKTITPNKINRRLLKDVANVLKNPLVSEGIYYSHDESNAYKGYAMIIGPDNSIYRYGYYLFSTGLPLFTSKS